MLSDDHGINQTSYVLLKDLFEQGFLIDPIREITETLQYIQEYLLDSTKTVELLLYDMINAGLIRHNSNMPLTATATIIELLSSTDPVLEPVSNDFDLNFFYELVADNLCGELWFVTFKERICELAKNFTEGMRRLFKFVPPISSQMWEKFPKR